MAQGHRKSRGLFCLFCIKILEINKSRALWESAVLICVAICAAISVYDARIYLLAFTLVLHFTLVCLINFVIPAIASRALVQRNSVVGSADLVPSSSYRAAVILLRTQEQRTLPLLGARAAPAMRGKP